MGEPAMKLTGTHFGQGAASGVTFVQTRFRPSHGVSLAPLQRLGVVPSRMADMLGFMGAWGPQGLGKAPPAGTQLDTGRPRVLPLVGSPGDPAMML